jgi:hypothetical protein
LFAGGESGDEFDGKVQLGVCDFDRCDLASAAYQLASLGLDGDFLDKSQDVGKR